MKITAAVVYEKGAPFVIDELDLSGPQKDEVLVKVVACGVCHTDEVAQHQIIPVPLPAVLGHEGCGIVVEVGPGVSEYAPGDRVGFSYGYCGSCESCLTGYPYCCERNRELNFGGAQFDGTRRLSKNGIPVSIFFGQGAFATHAIVHRNNLYKVPDWMDLALCGPLGCGIQTGAGAVLNHINPEPASSILITGCGAVGLSAVMAASIAGFVKIICVDTVPERLALALELGGTHSVNGSEDVVSYVMDITNGRGVHYAIDCTGNGGCVRRSLNCTRPMGACIVLGATQEVKFDCENELMGQSKTITGLVEGRSIPKVFIPKLLEYYRLGRFPFDKLVREYGLADINKAQADSRSGRTIKPLLRIAGEL